MAIELPAKGRQVRVNGALVTVRDAGRACDGVIKVFVLDADGHLRRILLSEQQLVAGLVPINNRDGDPERAPIGLWGRWMQHVVLCIRSAILATCPLRPYAHQDDVVHGHTLSQPRLRFLLGDGPGTGKTIMAEMCLTEGRRQGVTQGRYAIIVPAVAGPSALARPRGIRLLNARVGGSLPEALGGGKGQGYVAADGATGLDDVIILGPPKSPCSSSPPTHLPWRRTTSSAAQPSSTAPPSPRTCWHCSTPTSGCMTLHGRPARPPYSSVSPPETRTQWRGN
jgi:hypothetical protein